MEFDSSRSSTETDRQGAETARRPACHAAAGVTTARVAPVAGFPAEVREVSGPFPWVVRPDLAPDLFGERGERQQVRAGGLEVLCDFGELDGQRVDDPIILCNNRLRIGLVECGMQQG